MGCNIGTEDKGVQSTTQTIRIKKLVVFIHLINKEQNET